MRTIIKQFLQFSWATCLVLGTGCGSQEPDSAGELQLSLENPIIACQAQFDDCQRVPGGSGEKCRASMQSCLTSFAKWVEESQRLLGQCRAKAVQCRRTQLGRAAAMCETQFEQCVAPAFRPREEDAGVEDDAGTRMPPRRGPRMPSAGGPAAGAAAPVAGSIAAPMAGTSAAAGSGARTSSASVPTLPFTFPVIAPTAPADACGSALLECVASGTNLESCAMQGRECLRTSFGPGANR
jgi:hypothetical protein